MGVRSGGRKPRAQPKSASKRAAGPATVDEYLAKATPQARAALGEMRAALRSAAPPGAVETISYRIPALRTSKGILVWFAAFRDHCSLFPTARVITQFKDELKDFSISKGTIQFPLGKPLPVALIKKIVKARVEQLENKKSR